MAPPGIERIQSLQSAPGQSSLGGAANESIINGGSATHTNGVMSANGRDKDGSDAADRHVSEQNTNGMTYNGPVSADGMAAQASLRTDGKEVRCGLLLNYRHMEGSTWHGSVLIVLGGGI
ncbi:hypothetical protein DL98DRAFT_521187 [Cadophora sp. DSE1049]|nr:hypothetical protein DL98DRAFT_521187 [Cadophora sp. DSE1049]